MLYTNAYGCSFSLKSDYLERKFASLKASSTTSSEVFEKSISDKSLAKTPQINDIYGKSPVEKPNRSQDLAHVGYYENCDMSREEVSKIISAHDGSVQKLIELNEAPVDVIIYLFWI